MLPQYRVHTGTLKQKREILKNSKCFGYLICQEIGLFFISVIEYSSCPQVLSEADQHL